MPDSHREDEDRLYELENSVALLSAKLGHIHESIMEKFSAQQKALDVALTGSEQRFALLSEFRGSITDTLSTLRGKAESLSTNQAKTQADLQALRDRFEAAGRPNPAILIGGLSVLFALVGAAWFIVGLAIDNRIAPLMVIAEQSRADRAQLNDHVNKLEKTLTDHNIAEMQENQKQNMDLSRLRVVVEGVIKPEPGKGY
jgi:BioD-like phosphotransacetylase family protein